MSTHLITGFPGFIGRRLVASLLGSDPEIEIVALVEPRMIGAAETAAGEIDPARIEIVGGDISKPRLGLDDDTYSRLAAQTRVVHHLAAIYDLAVPVEIAQLVNVDGTGHVVDFCLDCEQLERHNYVSTAYVGGERTGVVYEHELAMGQAFKNHYESTKFQAEVWVRDSIDRVPTTIFRPGIVVGDSRTGETQKLDGPYYVLRMLEALAGRHLPAPNIGRGTAAFNVVPVDFIVAAMTALGSDQRAVGHTVHLCDPAPVSSKEMVGILSDLYSGKPPRYPVPSAPVMAALRFRPIREFFGGAPRESIRYLNHSVRYDTRRAEELLAPHSIPVPAFLSYAPTMVEFFRANSTDPVLLGKG